MRCVIESDRDVFRVLQERLDADLTTPEEARSLGVCPSTWCAWRKGSVEADFLSLMAAAIAVRLVIRVSVAGVAIDLVDRQSCALAWRSLMEARKGSIWNLEIQSGVANTTAYAAARGARRPAMSQLHALAITVGGTIELVEIGEDAKAESFVAKPDRSTDSASGADGMLPDAFDLAAQCEALERRIAEVDAQIKTLRSGSTERERVARLRAELHTLAADALRT